MPTAWISGKFCFSSWPSIQPNFAPKRFAMSRAAVSSSVGPGQDQAFAGLGGEAVGLGELPRLGGQRTLDRLPCRLGSEGDRNGCRGGSGFEHGGHGGLGLWARVCVPLPIPHWPARKRTI